MGQAQLGVISSSGFIQERHRFLNNIAMRNSSRAWLDSLIETVSQ